MEHFHDFSTAHRGHESGWFMESRRRLAVPGSSHSPVRLFAPAFVLALSAAFNAAAQSATNSVPLAPALPNVGVSLLRVLGALAIVMAVFLGGVWLVRNWQRLVVQRGRQQRLNVLEVRSLGGRHALYVVGYEQERFLVAASPTGVNLVSHLQPSEEDVPVTAPRSLPQPSFAQALTQMLKGK